MNNSNSLQEMVNDLVAIAEGGSININLEHITMLEGGPAERNRYNRRRHLSRRSEILPRRKYRPLCLYTIPRYGITYEEAKKIHKVWKSYVRHSLGINDNDVLPLPHQKGYSNLSLLLFRTDLHGARLEVLVSNCKTLVGLIGIVVLETRNTFQLVGRDNNLRTVPKIGNVFAFSLGNVSVSCSGNQLLLRSAERSVKKVKAVIDLDGVD